MPKITGLPAETSPTKDDLVVTVNAPSGSAETRKATIENFLKVINDLTAETAVATGDFVVIYDISASAVRKTTVSNLLGGLDAFVYKGVIDCSANPNYPAADAGHTYRVSVAGKIGGASGVNVEVGDILICTTDGTASGTQAAVGANWNILQVNIDGAVTLDGTQTLTNKTITDPTITALDSKFTVQDNSDPTKQFKFQASGITTATTRTYTVQDSDHVLVGRDTTDTLTNKTIDKDSNTITHLPFEMCIAVSDETTALTTGTGKITFRLPFAVTLTAVRASVNTAPTGATIIVDINEAGVSVLSTKLSIDVSEKTSTTAATPAVISDAALADDAEMSIDLDQVGSTIAGAGLKVWLIGKRT